MSKIEVKYDGKKCVLVLRDKDGNKGLYVEDSAGNPFAFIRSNSESFEKFFSDEYNRAELADELVKFYNH